MSTESMQNEINRLNDLVRQQQSTIDRLHDEKRRHVLAAQGSSRGIYRRNRRISALVTKVNELTQVADDLMALTKTVNKPTNTFTVNRAALLGRLDLVLHRRKRERLEDDTD